MNGYKADHGRYVSRLTRSTLALVLAGGKGSRLHELTDWRAKPAVYFGGKLRIIDFPLSNCINTGVRRIGVLTQYKAHSLIRHLVRGWTGFQAEQREFIEILPASQRMGGEWYQGTADAVYQNLDIIRTHDPQQVLILAGDHVYKMDYGPLLAWHAERKADMTICCIPVSVAEAAGQLGVMSVREDGRIVGFEEKPEHPTPLPGDPQKCLASMGNYVFDTQFLYDEVIRDADDPETSHDFGKNIIPHAIDHAKVYAYPFEGPGGAPAYWRDVGTLDAFWEANQELVRVAPQLDLYDESWPIYTAQVQLPGAKFVHDEPGRRGEAVNSIVSAGCVISGGSVRQSLLFSACKVHGGAKVVDSVVLPGCDIGRRARLRNLIVDRGCEIPADMEIGYDPEADLARGFRVTSGGHTLVTPDMLGQSLHLSR